MTTQSIDTDATRAIAASPLKLALLAGLGLGFCVIGWLMTQASESSRRYSPEMLHILGWVTLVFFGACTMIALWRLLTQRGPVITLSPQGLQDVRVSADVVPWTAIETLYTWQHSGQKVMVVGLKAGEEQKLRLTTIARLSRGANAKLGADGLAVTAQGTKIGHDDLMAAAIAYAQRYGRR